MTELPKYVKLLGLLNRDRAFHKLTSALEATDGAKEKIYPIMTLRFWCHVHWYTPVFSLLFYYLIGDDQNSLFNVTLSLVMLSIGSLSFAICDSIGGAYADKHGYSSAIRRGLKWMTGLMLFYASVTLAHDALGVRAFELLWFSGQIVVGFALAMIDSADTELTKQTVRNLNASISNKENYLDGDSLEGICAKLKYSGIAISSCLGFSMFIVLSMWPGASKGLVGAGLFVITAGCQLYAFQRARHVQEPLREKKSESLWVMLRLALGEIYRDKVLTTWVLIIAVTEGWLLFATYYFQLHALSDLINYSGSSPALLLTLVILFILSSQVAPLGGNYFNTWHSKRKEKEQTSSNYDAIVLRRGSVLDIPFNRLLAAGEILAIMVVVFVVHLTISSLLPVDKYPSGPAGYLLRTMPLCFFAVYQLLRVFAHPLLKTTLSNMASQRSVRHPVTTMSIASAFGRAFHCVCATMFAICLILITTARQKSDMPSSIGALTATIVVVVLTIVVLNVLSGIALDRKTRSEADRPSLPIFKEIASIFKKRVFRATFVKGIFFACLVLSNLLAPLHVVMGFLRFNAGAIPYALSFIFVETTAETEGKTASRRLWLAGVCSYFVVGGIVGLAAVLPVENTSIREVYLEQLVYIFASLCSFTIAQYMDIWVYLLLKRVMRGHALWLRSNLSTFVSQTIDTIIFISISLILVTWLFAPEPLTALQFGSRIVGQLGIKWIFSLIYTPLLYVVVRWVESSDRQSGPTASESDRASENDPPNFGLYDCLPDVFTG